MSVIPNYGLTNRGARSVIDNARQTNGAGLNLLKFPLDLDNVPHKFLMNFKKRNTTISMQDNGSNITNQTTITGAVALPVPKRIDEAFSVNYKSEDLGLINEAIRRIASDPSAAAGRLSEAISSPITAASTMFNNTTTADRVLSGLMFTQWAAPRLDRGLGQTLGAIASRITPGVQAGLGAILNPYTTASFTGVNLRKATFSWFLAPNSERESQELEKIIRAIRYNMLPKAASLTLEYPNEVEYQLVGMQEQYQIPTKPCVIEDFKIARAPFAEGGPAFFASTGAPVFVEIEITLLEVTPIMRDDLDAANLNPNNNDYSQSRQATPVIEPAATPPLIGAAETPPTP